MKQKKGTYLYLIIMFAVVIAIGVIQIFDKPSSSPVVVAPALNSSTDSSRLPAQVSNPVEAKYRAPVVTGDEVVVNVDPDDSKKFQNILEKAKPGDTLRLADGEYKTGALRLIVSGKPNHWIKIVAAEGAKPKINLLGEGDFHVSGSYIYLEGIEIFNGQKTNLKIASTTHTLTNIYAKKIKLHTLQGGPGSSLKIQRNNANGVGVSNIFIENCDLSQSTTASVVDAIGVTTAVLRNNFIHTDGGFAAGVTFKGGSSRILIENNFLKGARKNPAIIMGGRTFLNFFDPQYPDQEGVDQVVRNNIIVDFDESAVSFQGVKDAKFLHNTIVTNSSGPIFNFTEGNTNDGSKASKNHQITIDNNLIISRAPLSVFAVNESGHVPGLQFGKQMWVGAFTNSTTGRISIPQFPLGADALVPSQKAATILEGMQWKDVSDIETARVRFSPKEKSTTIRTTASISEVPTDFQGRVRSESTAFGAIEF